MPTGQSDEQRFFRTLQEHFEQSLTYDPVHELHKLNTRLWQWLETQYHNRPHSSLENNQTPIERYLAHTEHIKVIEDPNNIEELFFKTITRVVRKDSTISIDNTLWEVNPILRGKKIQIHYNPHSQEPTHKITYENQDYGTAVKCDKHLNSHFQSQNYDY